VQTPRHPPDKPTVTVVNTTTNPVPVVQQGTTTVSGSVSISGTPTVNVANFPSGTNTVQVSSSTSAPVIVRDADNQARQPFTARYGIGQGNGESSSEAIVLTVPAGKRAVIETVAVSLDVGPGQVPAAKITSGLANAFGGFADFPLPLTPQGSSFGLDDYVANSPMRLYADSNVTVHVFRSPATGSAVAQFSIAGYFVDAP